MTELTEKNFLVFDKPSYNSEWEAIGKQICRLNKHRKKIENLYKEKCTYLKLKMKDVEYVYDSEGCELITWKKHKQNKFQQKDFKEVHPDIYAEFCEEVEERTFLVKQ